MYFIIINYLCNLSAINITKICHIPLLRRWLLMVYILLYDIILSHRHDALEGMCD